MLKAVVAEPALARGCLGYCPVGLMSLGRGPSGRPGREAKTARIGCAPSTYVLSGWGQVGNLHFSAPGRRGRGKPPRGRLGLLGRLDLASASTHRVVFKFLGFPFFPFLPPAKRTKSWRKIGNFFVGGWLGGRRRMFFSFLPPAQKHQNLGESGNLFVGGWFGGRRRVRSRLFPQPTLSHCHCLNLLARAHCRMGRGDAPFAG